MPEPFVPLEDFIHPLIGSTAWGVEQGYGSFLFFNFGEPKLVVLHRKSKTKKPERMAYVQGASQIWIYCCHWRILDANNQIAFSEDSRETIAMATAFLNGQNLLAIEMDGGRSIFRFDLEGSLETWPYEDRPLDEQWMIYRQDDCLEYNGDGSFRAERSDTLPDDRARQSPIG